jgi:hypothetical protein
MRSLALLCAEIQQGYILTLFPDIGLSHLCTQCYSLIVRMMMSAINSFRFAFSLYASPCFFGGDGGSSVAGAAAPHASWGLGGGPCSKAEEGPNSSYVASLLAARFRNNRQATFGNTALNRGNLKPPCWTMTRFFAVRGRRLSAIERRLDLYFFNLRLLQSLN